MSTASEVVHHCISFPRGYIGRTEDADDFSYRNPDSGQQASFGCTGKKLGVPACGYAGAVKYLQFYVPWLGCPTCNLAKDS